MFEDWKRRVYMDVEMNSTAIMEVNSRNENRNIVNSTTWIDISSPDSML